MSSPRQPPRVALLPLTGADLPLVGGWLGADHVRRFWGEPEKNRRLLAAPPAGTWRALIEADGRQVGLVQWQHPSRQELDEAGLGDVPASVIDIDIMIGEPTAVGKGIGPAAIRLVVARALTDGTVPYVIAACMKANTASMRAFEKAGFREDREFDDPECGRCLLLVRRP